MGRKKLLGVIKNKGRSERRKVEAQLHKLSKEIVELANETNAVIVLGDLSGIRKHSETKGREFRARVARMPSFRMAQFIDYKAQWAEVLVLKIDETWTSKTCHACGSKGKRPHQ